MKLDNLKRPVRLITAVARKALNERIQNVPVKNILLGGECGLSANQYAKLINNPLRASTKFLDGPHWQLLTDYRRQGNAVFCMDAFKETSYYKNAVQVQQIFGRYFTARRDEELLKIAKRFVLSFTGSSREDWSNEKDHTVSGRLIRLRPVRHSSLFAVLDGNHRLAGEIWNGATHVKVRVSGPPEPTPAQEMLLDVLWQGGRCELYQPVDLPEVSEWPLMRKCTDRRDKMIRFADAILDGRQDKSYCDLGSSYGWFVDQMGNNGYQTVGVERDPFAMRVGAVVYGIESERLLRRDLLRFLAENQQKYDVVSFLSIIHHFLLSGEDELARTAMRNIDRMTKDVLFFETGEDHEAWFAKDLLGWNEERIIEWVFENSSFKQCYRLGRDGDNVGNFSNNYGRMLFAFTRRMVASGGDRWESSCNARLE